MTPTEQPQPQPLPQPQDDFSAALEEALIERIAETFPAAPDDFISTTRH